MFQGIVYYYRENQVLCRYQATLKEAIDPALLQQALDAARPLAEYYFCHVVWEKREARLEPNTAPCRVRQGCTQPKIPEETNDYLFSLGYEGNTVYLDWFHFLADGRGSAPFFTLLLKLYCNLRSNAGFVCEALASDPPYDVEQLLACYPESQVANDMQKDVLQIHEGTPHFQRLRLDRQSLVDLAQKEGVKPFSALIGLTCQAAQRYLEKLDIGYFFYIGGNDSMDTIGKLAEYGERIQSDIRFMGVPKTIDNDLMVTDHTPGYGSAAKYIGVVMKEIIRDATVYGTKYVTVVEIMGRNAGWLTAAAALAKSDDCEGVDMICLPEVPFNVEHFIEKVRVMQEKKPSIVIAVSEGVKLEDGRYVCELADDVHAVDAFGHKALTGTARYLANVVARNLDTKTRCIELSTLQRCAGHLTSRTDITEAYQVGGAAVKAAFEGVTGQMVALKRISNSPYQCTTELHPISEVANLEKKVPLSWMNENHTQMTEDFLAYARPLIQAELTPLYIAGLPHHIYMKPQK